MPACLGGVNRGNHWHVVKLGQRDGRVGDQPVMCVYDIGAPGLVALRCPSRESGADHGVAHGQCPGHHVVREVELVRVLGGRDDADVLADFIR